MKIDKETFEFQMRLVKAELKNETLAENNEHLKRSLEVSQAAQKQYFEQTQIMHEEIRALNKYIDRFIKFPQPTEQERKP